LNNAPDLIEQFWNNKKSETIILPPKINLEKKFQEIPQKLNKKKIRKDSGKENFKLRLS
jgi:hypothetical protein